MNNIEFTVLFYIIFSDSMCQVFSHSVIPAQAGIHAV